MLTDKWHIFFETHEKMIFLFKTKISFMDSPGLEGIYIHVSIAHFSGD